jgi:PAS domain S-box-containing protein
VRLNIGPRLAVCFASIILLMFGSDATLLWQFRTVRMQTERLNSLEQELLAVLRVHTSLLAFHDRLAMLADSENAGQLVAEAGPLQAAVLEEAQRARSSLSALPPGMQQDPTILPTLEVIRSSLQSQLEGITDLASFGDWRAVHLRLANQVHPLESLSSALIEKVDHEVGEAQVQTVLSVRQAQRRVFLIVPVTVFLTLMLASILGLAITRSITQPLAKLVEGSRSLARGEFQYQVRIGGEDELALLGTVFNDTALQLRHLYASLQDREEQLRRVINTIPAHAWSTTAEGTVDFINEPLLRFTGYTIKDLQGWQWDMVVHLDDLQRMIDSWRASLASGEPMEAELRMRRADGSFRWFLARSVPLRDEEGRIIKWYGTGIEIEDRKRVESQLRRNEAYLAEAQRLSHTGSFGWRVSTGEIQWSEQTYQIFGYDSSNPPSLSWVLERTHPDDRAHVQQILDDACILGANFDTEHRLLMPDGRVKYLHVVARGLAEPSGALEFVGAVVDITPAKQAEAALRENEEQWRDVFENNPTMYFMVNAVGTIIAINPLGAERLGYTVTELIGQSVLNVICEPDREAAQRHISHCLEQIGQSMTWEARKVCQDGTVIRVRETAKAVPRSEGPIVLIACEDTTEQKNAEEALRQAQMDLAHINRVNTMGELTASLAHELNQPIAAAVTNASACVRWLTREQPNVEEAREAALRIVNDGRRAGAIISKIRSPFKRAAPERVSVNINEVVRAMLVLLHAQAKQYSISIQTQLDDTLPTILGDRIQLQQVLMNLIVNSIDALKDVEGERELLIQSERTENQHLLLSISDTGVGLPLHQAEQIFKAFFTTKPHGIGMGLRISCSIIESHGGRLWAEPNSPRGAVFHLTLPYPSEPNG